MKEILNFVNSEEDTTEVPIYTDEEQEYFFISYGKKTGYNTPLYTKPYIQNHEIAFRREHIEKNNVLLCFLAGGRGTRLQALTDNLAKPAVPFGGKYRIIDFTLSNCRNSGIDTVGILTQYHPHVFTKLYWRRKKNGI
ncbi:hypothetical protein GCM10020331_074900 [Ectobacillus funiculus]